MKEIGNSLSLEKTKVDSDALYVWWLLLHLPKSFLTPRATLSALAKLDPSLVPQSGNLLRKLESAGLCFKSRKGRYQLYHRNVNIPGMYLEDTWNHPWFQSNSFSRPWFVPVSVRSFNLPPMGSHGKVKIKIQKRHIHDHVSPPKAYRLYEGGMVLKSFQGFSSWCLITATHAGKTKSTRIDTGYASIPQKPIELFPKPLSAPTYAWIFWPSGEAPKEVKVLSSCPADASDKERMITYLEGLFSILASHSPPVRIPFTPLPNQSFRSVTDASAIMHDKYGAQPWAISLNSENPRELGIHLGLSSRTPLFAMPVHDWSVEIQRRSLNHWRGISLWFVQSHDGLWQFETTTHGDIHVRRWLSHKDFVRTISNTIHEKPQAYGLDCHLYLPLASFEKEHGGSPWAQALFSLFQCLNRALLKARPNIHRRILGPLPLEGMYSLLPFYPSGSDTQPFYFSHEDILNAFPFEAHEALFDRFVHQLTHKPLANAWFSQAAVWNPNLVPTDYVNLCLLLDNSLPVPAPVDEYIAMDNLWWVLIRRTMHQFTTWSSSSQNSTLDVRVVAAEPYGLIVVQPDTHGYFLIPRKVLTNKGWFYCPTISCWLSKSSLNTLGFWNPLRVILNPHRISAAPIANLPKIDDFVSIHGDKYDEQ